MTKLLYRWGLGPVLNEKGTKCNQIVYINGGGHILYVFFTQLVSDNHK